MQEEVENRAVTLAISTTKLTAQVLKTAVAKYLAYRKEKKYAAQKEVTATEDVKPMGKQTVQELVGQNAGVSNIEVSERNIRGFDRVARKYGVDYAIKKDKTGEMPRYLVFFKARDADALTAAFTEFSNKKNKTKEKPSVLQKLRAFRQAQPVQDVSRERNKDQELER